MVFPLHVQGSLNITRFLINFHTSLSPPSASSPLPPSVLPPLICPSISPSSCGVLSSAWKKTSSWVFEQLETCQPGNYLPVTWSSGSELRPLQGENGGHISVVFIYFCSIHLLLPLSLSCLFSLIISLCIQTETGDVTLFRINRCGVFVLFVCFSVFFFHLSLPLSLSTACSSMHVACHGKKKVQITHTHTHTVWNESYLF